MPPFPLHMHPADVSSHTFIHLCIFACKDGIFHHPMLLPQIPLSFPQRHFSLTSCIHTLTSLKPTGSLFLLRLHSDKPQKTWPLTRTHHPFLFPFQYCFYALTHNSCYSLYNNKPTCNCLHHPRTPHCLNEHVIVSQWFTTFPMVLGFIPNEAIGKTSSANMVSTPSIQLPNNSGFSDISPTPIFFLHLLIQIHTFRTIKILLEPFRHQLSGDHL